MSEERYKQLMEQVGLPNSSSLLGALQQVANETAQKYTARIAALEAENARLREVHESPAPDAEHYHE